MMGWILLLAICVVAAAALLLGPPAPQTGCHESSGKPSGERPPKKGPAPAQVPDGFVFAISHRAKVTTFYVDDEPVGRFEIAIDVPREAVSTVMRANEMLRRSLGRRAVALEEFACVDGVVTGMQYVDGAGVPLAYVRRVERVDEIRVEIGRGRCPGDQRERGQ